MVAALSAWHAEHERAADALQAVVALPAHVLLEAYSVLTRLPSGLAVAPDVAANVLAERFPGDPLHLGAKAQAPRRLAAVGVFGGAAYDGLVALEARDHGERLLTLDARAESTYRRLGIDFRVI